MLLSVVSDAVVYCRLMQNGESLCEMRIVSGTMQKQDVVVQIDVNIGTLLPSLVCEFSLGFWS